MVSLPLALARGLFIVALLLAGVRLADPRWLHYLLVGLVLVYIVAFASSWHAYGVSWWKHRLIHLYYTTVSVGLAGALGVLLVIDWRARWWWKLPVGSLAVGALVFSGSRGAMAVLVVGALMAFLARGRRYLGGLAVGGALATLAYATLSLGQYLPALQRLLSLDLIGRDRIWQGALEAIQSHPWGGVGPYQLGPWLNSIYKGGCHLWTGAARLGLSCPDWLEPFHGAWLIAHNLLLHALGETGLVGTAGYLALLALLGYAAVRAREPLLAAIFFGYLVMSLVDNPMAVPSLHLSEVFWVAGGMALAQAGLAVPLEQGSAVDEDQLGPDPL
ncbi:O-antigen ligase family protein [Oceanithermus sp.]